MTGGDDILYLITLRNLEIHLVIGLCCFKVCFWDRAFNWLLLLLLFSRTITLYAPTTTATVSDVTNSISKNCTGTTYNISKGFRQYSNYDQYIWINDHFKY